MLLADGIQNFPKLVEDILQTSISTGPRGAVRLAQGLQALIGVGTEWLADVSAVNEHYVMNIFFFLVLLLNL